MVNNVKVNGSNGQRVGRGASGLSDCRADFTPLGRYSETCGYAPVRHMPFKHKALTSIVILHENDISAQLMVHLENYHKLHRNGISANATIFRAVIPQNV